MKCPELAGEKAAGRGLGQAQIEEGENGF